MDGNDLIEGLVQELTTGIDSFSKEMENVRIGARKAYYNTFDTPDPEKPELQDEVWQGLVNLVNIDAPEADIQAQEAAYDNLINPPDWAAEELAKRKKANGSTRK